MAAIFGGGRAGKAKPRPVGRDIGAPGRDEDVRRRREAQESETSVLLAAAEAKRLDIAAVRTRIADLRAATKDTEACTAALRDGMVEAEATLAEAEASASTARTSFMEAHRGCEAARLAGDKAERRAVMENARMAGIEAAIADVTCALRELVPDHPLLASAVDAHPAAA